MPRSLLPPVSPCCDVMLLFLPPSPLLSAPPGPVQCRHVALAGCFEDVLSITTLRPAMTPLPAHAAFQIAEVKLG